MLNEGDKLQSEFKYERTSNENFHLVKTVQSNRDNEYSPPRAEPLPRRISDPIERMTEDKIDENNPGEKVKTQAAEECKNKVWSQIVAAFIANLTLLICGIYYAWPSPLVNEHNGTPIESQEIDNHKLQVVAVEIGACAGPLLPGFLLDITGRKWFLYLSALPLLVGWILKIFAESWLLQFLARLIAGLAVGSVFTTVPIYLGEIAEPKIRGALVAMMVVLLNLGHVLVLGLSTITMDPKVLPIICAIPVLVFLLTYLWIPESPYHYLKRKHEKLAKLSLIWLRRETENDKVVGEITQFVDAKDHPGGYSKLFSHEPNRKALLILLLVFTAQQFSGLLAIQSYSIVLVPTVARISVTVILIILSLVCLVASLLTTFVVDRFGRKPLFLTSAYGIAFCLAALGTYILLKNIGMRVETYAVVPVVVLIVYNVFLSIGLSSVPAILSSEIFPSNVKTCGVMVSNIYRSVLGVIIALCSPVIIKVGGYHVIFYVFCVLQLILATIAIFVVPETSRKCFGEIQNMLNVNKDKKDGKNEGK